MEEDICRICLGQRRNLRSVFQREKNSTSSFSEMIMFLSNIKIIHNDGYPDKICLLCRNKLKDAYDFKCLIESSDKQLKNIDDSTTQKLYFNNFCDIEIKMDCFKIEPNIKSENPINDIITNSSEGADVINYGDISIKRIDLKKEKLNNDKPALSVEDFLNTIKEETDEVEYYNDMNSDDDIYVPPTKHRSKKLGKYNKNKDIQNEATKEEDGIDTIKEEIDDNAYYDDNDMYSDDDIYVPPSTYRSKKLGKRKYNKCKENQKGTTKKKKDTQKQEYVNSYGKKVSPVKPIILKDVRVSRTQPIEPVVKKRVKYKARTKETICPYCGKLTKSIHSHLLIHTGERKYKCSECQKSYFTQAHLTSHMVIHSGIKKYSCDQCVAKFYKIESLRSHMQNHLTTKSHICDICSKGFKRKSTLHKHVIRHNSANKNIMCELCNMSFFEKWQLTHHMRIHTGERPYKCELCSQPYSYKHDFNRHCFNKHGVFLKRRSVFTMNATVLSRERALMKQLAQGMQDNPFQGPQAALAYEYALRALKNNKSRLLDT